MLISCCLHPLHLATSTWAPARSGRSTLVSSAKSVRMSSVPAGANGHTGPSTSAAEALSQSSAQTVVGIDGQASGRTPLSVVVTDAVKRWYMDTNKEAVKGDVKQQALLGQMLIEGYGCEENQAAARIWVDKAKRRGYRMAGVYCEI